MTDLLLGYGFYDPTDGRIIRYGQSSSPEALALVEPPDLPGVLVVYADVAPDPDVDYVADGALAARPVMSVPAEMAIAVGQTDPRWIAAPAGTLARYGDSEPIPVNDGRLYLRAETPGDFLVEILPPFPWIEARVAVSAS